MGVAVRVRVGVKVRHPYSQVRDAFSLGHANDALAGIGSRVMAAGDVSETQNHLA